MDLFILNIFMTTLHTKTPNTMHNDKEVKRKTKTKIKTKNTKYYAY